jgi:hypothetical protein
MLNYSYIIIIVFFKVNITNPKLVLLLFEVDGFGEFGGTVAWYTRI